MTGGIKLDKDKPDLTLNPKRSLELMARAFMYGAAKYQRLNYRKGLDPVRCLSAALRHITEYTDWLDCQRASISTTSTELDSESGVSHLGHALASIAMAIENLPNMTGGHGEVDTLPDGTITVKLGGNNK